MPATIIVGAQWGDEGKGKATDLLADATELVVRYQGGNNAGHTIVVAGEVVKLHLIPSGVLYPHVTPVIAPGVVVDPRVLLEEIDGLDAKGLDASSRVRVSGDAHLIMPWHRELDRLIERRLGSQELGTTRRGIGPAYADKAARVGLRVQDLFDAGIFAKKLEAALDHVNLVLTRVYDQPAMDPAAIRDEYLGYAARMAPLVTDTRALLHEALERGARVMLEGAQGTMLDLDHGTYPYVTSSSPVAGGALAGAGLGPTAIDRVIGITKAYVTRVGAGPFPTELDGDLAETLTERGGEYGTTTGRRRRVGWFDAVVARYAQRVNGFTDLFLTKLDVLGGLGELKVCTAYVADGVRHEHLPAHQSLIHHAVPQYETVPGWEGDITGVTRYADLPAEARAYVELLEARCGAPVTWVSVGPGREQTLERAGAAARA